MMKLHHSNLSINIVSLLIKIVEQFLLSQLKPIYTDKLIMEAVKFIYQSNGTNHIKELNQKLYISLSPSEKRFRKLLEIHPKIRLFGLLQYSV